MSTEKPVPPFYEAIEEATVDGISSQVYIVLDSDGEPVQFNRGLLELVSELHRELGEARMLIRHLKRKLGSKE